MFAITNKLINLTPHALNIKTSDGQVLKLDPSGDVARVNTINKPVFSLDTGNNDTFIPVHVVLFGDVIGLPSPQDGVFLIVSRIVKNAVPTRRDVLVPGAPIRNDDGVIIGADGLTL